MPIYFTTIFDNYLICLMISRYYWYPTIVLKLLLFSHKCSRFFIISWWIKINFNEIFLKSFLFFLFFLKKKFCRKSLSFLETNNCSEIHVKRRNQFSNFVKSEIKMTCFSNFLRYSMYRWYTGFRKFFFPTNSCISLDFSALFRIFFPVKECEQW